MSKPRVLVMGSHGQVGWELVRALAPIAEVTGVDYPQVDLAKERSLQDCVQTAQPQVIINAAAYTAVDRAESELERALAINGVAPEILAREAKARGAWLVHYSTDYVFDGTGTRPYSETDAPNPLSAYGRTKLAGDEAVRQAGCRHLIFRLCWVYGTRGQNFLRTVVRLARERDELRVVNDQFGCPTWSRMIAEATAHALARVWTTTQPEVLAGTYHLAAAGQTTWHGFAEAILQGMPAEGRRCQRVQAISTAEYPALARRPAWSVLACSKLERTFGLQLPDWRQSLQRVLEDLA